MSAQYNAALVNAASNLQAAFSDMLRSPGLGGVVTLKSPSIQKPLPGRTRSTSALSSPELPAELPGSLLLHNQGFPCPSSPSTAPSSRPTSWIVRRESHPPDKQLEKTEGFLDLSRLFPATLTHARIVPDLTSRHSTMRSVRSGTALNAGVAAEPAPFKIQYQQSLSQKNLRRRSGQDLTSPPLYAGSKYENVGTSKTTNVDLNVASRRSSINGQDPTKSRNAEKRRSHRNEVSANCFFVGLYSTRQARSCA